MGNRVTGRIKAVYAGTTLSSFVEKQRHAMVGALPATLRVH